MPDRRRRGATYRVQLNGDFGFDQAAAITDYLARLGITHLYTSPYLQAAPGSTHGYDVVDHSRVNRELGGEEGHGRLMAALATARLGHMIDVVPNHMSIAVRGNRWWWDVLQHGPASRYASYFDVDWDPPEARLRNQVLLPVLGDHYGRVLEAGEITLTHENGSFTLRYGEHVFPVNVGAGAAGAALVAALPEGNGEAPDDLVRRINSDIELLHELIERQNYRLAWWQAAGRDLGYRRFFDVNSLIGLCVENEDVFRDTHQLVRELVHSGAADALRIDHPDGLRDPEAYLERLREMAPDAWVVVEKILEPGEALPETWKADGTTGYEFLNIIGGLFVDGEAEEALTGLYARFTGEPTDWMQVAHDRKLQVLRDVLGSDVNRLAELLLGICERHRRHRDYTRHQLTDALREVLAYFPTYRTYVRPAKGSLTDADRCAIATGVSRARDARPDLDAVLLDFIESLLTLRTGGKPEHQFVQRFQQLSGPATAKGIEDTAFYNYNRFVAVNEVGGDPGTLGTGVAAFHQAMKRRQERHPFALNATATHDTKRGEDTRARLCVLSEMPDEWAAAVERWSLLTERHRAGEWPDRNTEYLFYQTVVGAWPLETDRAVAYMEKATREAKTHTSWLAPNEAYDAAIRRFVEQSLADAGFTDDVAAFVKGIQPFGRINALAQVLLKMTAPGVPDFYQGTELWSNVLVDPDNRRPVDYGSRLAMLGDVSRCTAAQAMARVDEGFPKLWLIHRTLAVRAERPGAFGQAGAYQPVEAHGPCAAHVVAFMRGGEVITIVPRLSRKRGADWVATMLRLPRGRWRNALTGDLCEGDVSVESVLAAFPVALLAREEH